MKLAWDQAGTRLYETGVKKVALYPMVEGAYPKGVAWNGVSSITESPSGAEPTAIYADDIKYLNLYSAEDLGLTIEAYTYPDEFAACDGTAEIAQGVSVGQQVRQAFGLAYQTVIGNDTEDNGYGYKLHLVYGCKASPSEKAHNSINESPEVDPFSWEVSTVPVEVPGMKPSATITLDSTKVNKEKLAELEKLLFGSEDSEAKLPLPAEVIALFAAATE